MTIGRYEVSHYRLRTLLALSLMYWMGYKVLYLALTHYEFEIVNFFLLGFIAWLLATRWARQDRRMSRLERITGIPCPQLRRPDWA